MQHTNTRIHRRGLELVRLSHQVTYQLPPGYAFLSDQLKRASASVVLNYAEGTGKSSARDRRRFFTIAKASACEVAAIFDVAHAFELIDGDTREAANDIADHLAAMLHRFR